MCFGEIISTGTKDIEVKRQTCRLHEQLNSNFHITICHNGRRESCHCLAFDQSYFP